jgi:hypothetical protein
LAVPLRLNYPVRKSTLAHQGKEGDVRNLTPAQRMAMVWTLSVQAWQFKEPTGEERKLRRQIVRTIRRPG